MIYKTIFNIDLLHAYFLDKGVKKYHATNPLDELTTAEKEEVEKNYKLNSFIEIIPNTDTKKIVKNYRLFIRNHDKGIRVLASTLKVHINTASGIVERYHPIIPLSKDVTFTFYIKATDHYFENYTDIIDRKEHQLYYFSNITSTATNAFEANTNLTTLDEFLISAKETRRLLYELEKQHEFTSILPKGVSITDIASEKIEAMEDKIIKEKVLSEEEEEILETLNRAVSVLKNNKIIGIVQLKISGDDDTKFTEIVDTENESTGVFDQPKQCLLSDEIDFQVYIENKKTFWRYHQKSENQIMITNQKQPLIKNGRIDISTTDVTPQPSATVFFPNPTVASITQENESEHYYSEIYI